MFIFDNGDDNSDLNKLLPHNKTLCQAFKSFREEQKNNLRSGIMYEWRVYSGDEYFLIGRDMPSDVFCFILLDKRLFDEKILNIIKNCHSFYKFLPTIRKELENQFDMKDELFPNILGNMYVDYYDKGDCVLISTTLLNFLDYTLNSACALGYKRYEKNSYILVEKLTTLSSNIVKFFSNPEYYKDMIRNKISELEEDEKLLNKCI